MSILSRADYKAARKQIVRIWKTNTRTTIANYPYSIFDRDGTPEAGTLSAGNTANGTVPTPAVTGYPQIIAPANTLYLTAVRVNWNVLGLIYFYDRLFCAGAYSYNADTTLASQPSYASRLPGTDYNSLELWFETVTAFTGTPNVQVNYLDQDGNAGDTGSISAGFAPAVGYSFQIPLAAGDTGIQQITRVRCTTASAGTFNISVHRPGFACRISKLGQPQVFGLFDTGMKIVYSDTAFFAQVSTDSTSSGTPYIELELADG